MGVFYWLDVIQAQQLSDYGRNAGQCSNEFTRKFKRQGAPDSNNMSRLWARREGFIIAFDVDQRIVRNRCVTGDQALAQAHGRGCSRDD